MKVNKLEHSRDYVQTKKINIWLGVSLVLNILAGFLEHILHMVLS